MHYAHERLHFSEINAGNPGAGFSWMVGWACEMAWQLAFQLQSPLGMWLSLGFILGGLACFAQALLRLYG